jgi:protein involved in polysaccharide export with SLBB domain
MNVIGMTPERFTAILREELAPFTSDPIIMVVPLIRVTLMGEFRRPGSYRTDPSNALWGLIEEAGGPGAECNFRKMRLMRGDKTVVQSLLESWEKGWSLSEIGVRTGDIIYAPAKPRITFRDFVYYFQFVVSILSLYVAFKRWG